MRVRSSLPGRQGQLLCLAVLLFSLFFTSAFPGPALGATCEDWSSCQTCHYEAFVVTDFHHTVLYRSGQYGCNNCHYMHNCMYVCSPCHGDISNYQHGNANHTSSPGSGEVTIFPDNGHDDAGWAGTKPYFAVTVECAICHEVDLQKIHGNNCATCHPNPYSSLGTWNGTCQQGGCHATYHDDSAKVHAPFEDSLDSDNDCLRCHDKAWAVPQSNCLNCHAPTGSGYTAAPVTTANVRSSYIGPAKIDFSISVNGKVGLGRTFYKLDGGTTLAAGKSLFVSAPGSHTLEFWSVDQAATAEAMHRTASFAVTADTTPPTTTSNAQSSYYQTAVITLSAVDVSTLGVKATYYQLNDGVTQVGTAVVVPATPGVTSYTLSFWSEDWSGNIEAKKTVSFSVTSGQQGILRLVWGDSDAAGSPCPGEPSAWASWVVRKNDWWGAVVASGYGECPNWSGVDDISVPVGPTKYFVVIDWWNSADGGYEDATVFPSVYVTAPGQVVRLSY